MEWGIWESMYYFTTAIGALIGGLIVSLFGFSSIFTLMSVLCFSSAIYLGFLVPKKLFEKKILSDNIHLHFK